MVKFSNVLGSLFQKKRSSKLETDASPMAPRPKDDRRQTNTINAPPANGNSPNGDTNQNEAGSNQNEPSREEDNVGALIPVQSRSVEPMANGAIVPSSTSVVNNVQHNTLTAPQTSISNTTGMQVFQIKNASNLHIGNSYTFNRPAAQDECASTSGLSQPANVKWANLKLSNTISQMMRSQDEVDTEVLDIISRHLGYEWKSFARKLEYSEGQIDAFESDHPTLSEQIYHFVLDWTRNDDDPSLGRLVTLLWNHKQKETVYYIKQVWKKRREDSNGESNS